jgi:xylulokinase
MSASGDTGKLLIGLDSSTQSTKALVCDAQGNIVAEGRAAIPLAAPRPGSAEQDVEDWWLAAIDALGQVARQIDMARVAGLAVSNQRETSAFLDADGRATHPALVWLDERGGSEIPIAVEALGRDWLHSTTGKPPDLTPVFYRLAWMRRHKPEVLDRSAWILDVQGFLVWRLTGAPATSWTSADPFTIFDIQKKRWSAPLLDYLGISENMLAPAHKPGTKLGEITAKAAAATGLAVGTPVFAAGGDGQCAGLGVDAVRPGRVYLNLGTAVITGLWTQDCVIDRNWRTMTSPTGEGYFLESCQRAGAFLVNWFADTLAGSRDDATFARLEESAAKLPVGAEGLLLCPYLTGCMDPHWDPDARAAFVGLSPHHGIGHLYRAMLEAITLESARAIDAMVAAGIAADEIVAIGGGAKSALWRQIYADATGLPVRTGRTIDASAIGAAMTAAVGAGIHESFAAAAKAMSSLEPPTLPDPRMKEQYAALAALQGDVYRANAALFARLKPLRDGVLPSAEALSPRPAQAALP